jgi:hypothetical protein
MVPGGYGAEADAISIYWVEAIVLLPLLAALQASPSPRNQASQTGLVWLGDSYLDQ